MKKYKCKKCKQHEVPRRGMLCPACRKSRGSNGGRVHNGRAAAVLARNGSGQPIGHTAPAPEMFTTRDILSLYCARRNMSEQNISDRVYPYLFAECSDIADLLNGARDRGRGRALAEWKAQQSEMENAA